LNPETLFNPPVWYVEAGHLPSSCIRQRPQGVTFSFARFFWEIDDFPRVWTGNFSLYSELASLIGGRELFTSPSCFFCGLLFLFFFPDGRLEYHPPLLLPAFLTQGTSRPTPFLPERQQTFPFFSAGRSVRLIVKTPCAFPSTGTCLSSPNLPVQKVPIPSLFFPAIGKSGVLPPTVTPAIASCSPFWEKRLLLTQFCNHRPFPLPYNLIQIPFSQLYWCATSFRSPLGNSPDLVCSSLCF